MDLQKQNLFQMFSEIFIESQQSFSTCDIELRTKCRTLAEKLNILVDSLEADPFGAQLSLLSTLEEDTLRILRNVDELENRRTLIMESMNNLKVSTRTKVHRRK